MLPANALRQLNVSHKVDESGGSIGRRYARTDQVAIPFGVTVDFDTLKEPHSVTLRERDTLQQVRLPVCTIPILSAPDSFSLLYGYGYRGLW